MEKFGFWESCRFHLCSLRLFWNEVAIKAEHKPNLACPLACKVQKDKQRKQNYLPLCAFVYPYLSVFYFEKCLYLELYKLISIANLIEARFIPKTMQGASHVLFLLKLSNSVLCCYSHFIEEETKAGRNSRYMFNVAQLVMGQRQNLNLCFCDSRTCSGNPNILLPVKTAEESLQFPVASFHHGLAVTGHSYCGKQKALQPGKPAGFHHISWSHISWLQVSWRCSHPPPLPLSLHNSLSPHPPQSWHTRWLLFYLASYWILQASVSPGFSTSVSTAG